MGNSFFNSSATARPTHVTFVLTFPFLDLLLSYHALTASKARSGEDGSCIVKLSFQQRGNNGLLHQPRHHRNGNRIAESVLDLGVSEPIQVEITRTLKSCVFQPSHPTNSSLAFAKKHHRLLG